jgi:hypothetical protein
MLGRPLPDDLEGTVLACLAKDPAERPRDARALIERLEACARTSPWTSADAVEWWRARGRHAPERAAGPSGGGRAVTVDLRERS